MFAADGPTLENGQETYQFPALGMLGIVIGFAAVIASTNLWPLLFGLYWKRTSPRATLWSMIAGVTAALLWQAWPRITALPDLPPVLAGVHGFVVGTAVGLVVIVAGTFLGRPPAQEHIDKAWGSR